MQPIIVVVGSDSNFANTLAEQVVIELSLPCEVLREYSGQALPKGVALMVTADILASTPPCPVLKLKAPPYAMHTLLSDIDSACHRQGSEIALGRGYRVQPRLKQLVHVPSGKEASLTDKEMQLLQCLFDAAGDVVTKEQLLKVVWDVDAVLDTHTLETHIYRLRSKFREIGGGEDESLIAASEGGYIWMEE